MRPENLLKENNAVSFSIGFILMFAVTVLVFTALIYSFYTLTQRSEKTAMEESFKIMGSGLAAKITLVDMLINTTRSYGGTVNMLEYEFSIPASAAGNSYSMNITNSTYEIIMEADNGAKIVIPFNISTNINERKIYSSAEDYKFVYKNNSMYIVEQ